MSSNPAEPALPVPSRFGDGYTLVDRIGAGGMAELYLARRMTRIGAAGLAVVKVIHPHLAVQARFAELLTAEARLAAQLSHANIVQTYDLGRHDGRLYLAMEYVEGFDLNELLRRCSKNRVTLPARFAFFIALEVFRALDYAHRRKSPEGVPLALVHRDVSPSNVLISFEGEVKLCDFGIARATGADPSQHGQGIEGKASYMAPEHARGEEVDARADVFSASVVLWELLAGRRMHKAPGPTELLELARSGATPPLPERGLAEHVRLAALVAKGLAADRNERYPTARALLDDLDDYVRSTGMQCSPLELGDFLTEHFAEEIVALRRERERSAAALEEAAGGHLTGDLDMPTVLDLPSASADRTQPMAPLRFDDAEKAVAPAAIPLPVAPVAPPPTAGNAPEEEDEEEEEEEERSSPESEGEHRWTSAPPPTPPMRPRFRVELLLLPVLVLVLWLALTRLAHGG